MIWTCKCSSAVCSELTNNPNDLDAISYFVSHRINIGETNIPRRSYSIDLDRSDPDHEVLVLLYFVQLEWSIQVTSHGRRNCPGVSGNQPCFTGFQKWKLTELIRWSMLVQMRSDLWSTKAFLMAWSGSSIDVPPTMVLRRTGLPALESPLGVGWISALSHDKMLMTYSINLFFALTLPQLWHDIHDDSDEISFTVGNLAKNVHTLVNQSSR